jgi:hypothetical protein
MKGKLGLVICGVVLMAAPAWADRADFSVTEGDFGNSGNSAKVMDGSSFGLNLGSTSNMDGHHFSLGGVESDGIGAVARGNWVRADRHFAEGLQDPTLVAEPGTLSLILLGLVGVGLLARRRDELPTSI